MLGDICLLGGEPISIGRSTALPSLDAGLELESSDPGALFEELFVRHFVESIELPPVHFVLAPMPLEELREDPLRLLDPISLKRQIRDQRIGHGADARQSLTEILALLGKGWRRPVEGRAPIPFRLQPQLLQPASQLERRDAVVAVV